MDYDMTRLGDKQFEHLAQALLVKYLGPTVQVFGAGPDGGREAAWTGPVADPRLPSGWDGYGVAQAKYMHNPRDPKANLAWLRRQIIHEFREWTKPDTRRQRLPEYYLVITNVNLSATPGGGIDTITEIMTSDAKKAGLSFKGFAVWHYDQIRVMLDGAPELHTTYAAWTTPGDVLARLIQASNDAAKDLADALRAHAAKMLVDDRRLNLTQAGSVGDGQVGLADVFIDLPAYPPTNSELETKLIDLDGLSQQAIPGIVAELLAIGDRKFDDLTLSTDPMAGRASRTVIIGGPGQGKSTIGQYLCQIYRASFLAGSPILSVPDVRLVHDAVLSHADEIGLPKPGARRWPVRIVLSDFADKLSDKTCNSVLDYITQQLAGRSGLNVSLPQVRAWLREYPWFVVFDGLDEVPQASNRSEVLGAIADFFIDVRSIGGDVLVVATSRPQGYNDEFGREQCRHYELSPLPTALATSYAKRLIDLRTGAGSDRARRISMRLERAAKEESTSRLLTTPLQVTILTLLLERLGHAPRDRWRLFSQYYRVIYQREQEKGGDLADLLHTHESDVNAIHYKVGLLLQQRGERSGDTRGALTAEEFKGIIARRLQSQGNDRGYAEALAERLINLATDRLVFLAILGGGEIGFEIRSLQEFMAAEALLARPDARAVDGLRAIASSLYWRNVFLFAAGRVFADKEHLRSDIATICADLNLESRLHEATLPGSRLALDILRERVTTSQPVFTRVLSEYSTQLLRLPPNIVRASGLESLAKLDARSQLFNALDTALRGPVSGRLSGVALLATLSDSGDEAARDRLVNFFSNSDEDFRRRVLADDYSYTSPTLVEMLKEEIASCSPSQTALMGYQFDREPRPSATLRTTGDMLPPHVFALMRLARHFQDPARMEIALRGIHPNAVVARLTKVGESGSLDFQTLKSTTVSSGPWLMVKRFAEFTCEPSVSALADALEEAANYPAEARRLAHIFSWPLAACLRFDEQDSGGQGRNAKDYTYPRPSAPMRYLALAAAARAGLLGDETDWRAAEDRWSGEEWSLDDISYVPGAPLGSGSSALPFGSEVGSSGAVLPAAMIAVSHPKDQNDSASFKQGIRQAYVACRNMPPSQQRASLAYAILFASSVVFRKGLESSAVKGAGRVWRGATSRDYGFAGLAPAEVFELLRLHKGASGFLSDWLQGMPASVVAEFEEEIVSLGRQRLLWVRPSRITSRVGYDYFDAWKRDSSKWPFGRLRFHFSPTRVEQLPSFDDQGDVVARNFRLFAEAVALNVEGNDEADEAWLNKNFADLFSGWPEGGLAQSVHGLHARDSLDFDRLVQWLTHPNADARGYSLPSRLAILVSHERPSLGAELVDTLYAIVQSRPSGAIPD